MAAAVVMGSLKICSHCEKTRFNQQGEEHFHLAAGLLDVADVVDDQYFVRVETAQFALMHR